VTLFKIGSIKPHQNVKIAKLVFSTVKHAKNGRVDETNIETMQRKSVKYD